MGTVFTRLCCCVTTETKWSLYGDTKSELPAKLDVKEEPSHDHLLACPNSLNDAGVAKSI